MSLLLLAAPTTQWHIWLGPVLALLGSIALAVVGYFALRRKRLMQNVPTSKVKGVFIGLNELKGAARVAEPLTSYLAEEKCIWYSYKIEEEWERRETSNDGDGNSKTETKSGWTVIDDGEQRQVFHLEDDTGEIRVLPEKAKFIGDRVLKDTVRRTESLYHGKGPRRVIADSTGRRRFVEHAIRANSDLYLLGSARVREDVVEPEIAYDELDKLFLISSKSEESLTRRYALISFFSFLGGTVAMAFFPWGLAFALSGGGFCGAVTAALNDFSRLFLWPGGLRAVLVAHLQRSDQRYAACAASLEPCRDSTAAPVRLDPTTRGVHEGLYEA